MVCETTAYRAMGDNHYNGGHWQDDEDEDNFFKWCYGYRKRKEQKARIKEDLMPIAWHPSRYWDWCLSEDEKREKEKLFLTT